ncbi:MAG TPA: hypothetical protein VN132_09215 [Bdellovibrio sp.]|nr:hypothetical protein [Bdellovibrio sp.]
MMRTLLLALTLSFLSLGFLATEVRAAGNSNPLIRFCHGAGGDFWAPENETGDNDYPLCLFGQAAIGADALLKFKTKNESSQSIDAYKSGAYSRSSVDEVCADAGSDSVQGTDSNGQTFTICNFRDGSLIEANTLIDGPGSSETRKLDQALSSN